MSVSIIVESICWKAANAAAKAAKKQPESPGQCKRDPDSDPDQVTAEVNRYRAFAQISLEIFQLRVHVESRSSVQESSSESGEVEKVHPEKKWI